MRIVPIQPCSSIMTVACVLDNVSHDLASNIPPLNTPTKYDVILKLTVLDLITPCS